ncbi:beta-1,6-N-acetylglucosaminyltransferase [Silvibacterium sp.]|uniref:beta-1,6-N-acetylglucosaminyltransferase n=1 Tax=Silvibacterium sp. TaxID=1964179 RepID=UPI0039E4F4C1
MAIAYLIVAHKSPDQILRLVRALHHSGAFFVIHIDKRAADDVYVPLREYAASHPEVLLTKRHRCYWGSFGIAQAMIACVNTAIRSNRPFEYAFLLSGQDYPIKNTEQIAAFLEQNKGKEFMESFSLTKPNRWTEQGGAFQAMARVMHWTLFLRSRTFHFRIPRKFPFGWEPYGGSQWWCLSREALAHIESFLRKNRSYLRYFKHVFIPDEAIFQSILSNSEFRDRIVNDDLRYIDWENPNPLYPRTLESNDFEKLAASPKLFARKFQPDRSAECLDLIDARFLGIASEHASKP